MQYFIFRYWNTKKDTKRIGTIKSADFPVIKHFVTRTAAEAVITVWKVLHASASPLPQMACLVLLYLSPF